MRDKSLPPAVLFASLALMMGTGCAKGTDPADAGDPVAGKALYESLCASCHGTLGQGGLGPKLNPWTKGAESLVDVIDSRMPPSDPSLCDDACPEDIAAYILSWSDPSSSTLPPQRLRLLSRREYNSTVRDLLFPSAGPTSVTPGGACQSDADCDVAHESCTGGVCVQDPCGLHTFVFSTTQTYSSVFVAGSFNSWSAGDAGYKMTHAPSKGLYYLKHTFSTGNYTYKFVADNTWLADPQNPTTVDDGFGGKNSVLDVGTCPSGGPTAPSSWNPSKSFPIETRPSSYPFDNNASAGLVTANHVDQYMVAAEELSTLFFQTIKTHLACYPPSDPASCAKDFAEGFGKRAFRRPLTAVEAQRYTALVLAQKDFDTGLRVGFQAMLSSPNFLYKFEIGEPSPAGGNTLTPYEVASELSYLFWGTMPDQALFDAAASGALATQAGIDAEAKRLFDDPRARANVEAFALAWLGVEGLGVADKSSDVYPGFDAAARRAMLDETRRFVSDIVFDGSGRYEDLLLSKTTFVNAGLASLYGISGVSGDALQKVEVPADRQAGLLAQGSVLALYAKPDESSPVARGAFLRRRLLCQELPPPPAKVPPLPPVDPNASTRDRLNQHTANPACHNCHQYIDPVGFGFERFDGIGRMRATDGGKPIDASGDMLDVEEMGKGVHAPFDGLPALAGLLANSKRAEDCFATQIQRFASGALESPEDVASLTTIQSAMRDQGGSVKAAFLAVTKTPGFLRRR